MSSSSSDEDVADDPRRGAVRRVASSDDSDEDDWVPPTAGDGGTSTAPPRRRRRQVRRISSSEDDEEGEGDVTVVVNPAATSTSDGGSGGQNVGADKSSFVLANDSLEGTGSVKVTPARDPGRGSDSSTDFDDVIGPSPETTDDEDDIGRGLRGQLKVKATGSAPAPTTTSPKKIVPPSSSPKRNVVASKTPGLSDSQSLFSPDKSPVVRLSSPAPPSPHSPLPQSGTKQTEYLGEKSSNEGVSKKGSLLEEREKVVVVQQQQHQNEPLKQRKIRIMTSTPLVSSKSAMGPTDLNNLNMTAIPGKPPKFNMSAISDETTPPQSVTYNYFQQRYDGVPPAGGISKENASNWRESKLRDSSDDDDARDKTERTKPHHPSKSIQKKKKHVDKSLRGNDRSKSNCEEDDLEDIINAGIEKISFGVSNNDKTFTFKKKKDTAVGATCSNYFDEEEELSANLSANFDLLDVGNEEGGKDNDDDIQVVYDDEQNHEQELTRHYNELESAAAFVPTTADYKKPSTKPKPDGDDDDDLKILTEKLGQLPLGKTNKLDVRPPTTVRKAIFLNEPPPIERKTYSYNPLNTKHEEFYGDVRRTVTMLAKSIEGMPTDEGDGDLSAIPDGLVPLYDHQKYGLRWLSWRESQFPGGGILADEMGLGKTIMIIALIMKSKIEDRTAREKENWVDPKDIRNCIPSQTTLVVCPMGCLLQWSEEIASKGKGLRVTMYHGPKKTGSAARLAQSDIVLTTYGTVGSEIPKDDDESRLSGSPLKRIYWKRIVLDEAHNVRNPKTVSATAIHKLVARHRWAVTGTPVHNRPEDFFSIVKFLRMVPFDDPKVWDFWIGLKKLKTSEEARQRLHTIGKALILRRTKEEVQIAGGNVKAIPPKTVDIIKVDLPEEENTVYQHLMKYAKQLFTNFLTNKQQREMEMQGAAMAYDGAARTNKKKNNVEGEPPTDIQFSHLFTLILRLRQCAVLPGLIKKMLEDEDVDDDATFDEDLEEHIISKRNPVFDDFYESAKIKRILEDLEQLREQAKQEERYMDKVVIVSSWTSLLEIINHHLRHRKFSSVFITGKEGAEERRDAQKAFNRGEKRPQIALLSLKAGGVGINLVGGNHVFFVEPHWNPQMELQAQDRVHRFGQEKDVFVRRYITTSSIEDRILELQQMKKDLADGVLNSNKKRGAKGGGLSVEQMKHLFEI